MARDLGLMGESTFSLWCADVGLIPNGSQIDKTGWDFFVEFPFTPSLSPHDIHKPAFECKVQVKATDQSDRKLPITLVFKNIDLSVHAGESVAIVGPSGVGKSTLLSVLMGLSLPTEGNVCIDGRDIKSVGLSTYRKNIASVAQDDTLVSGFIVDNITFFDKNPDMNLVAKCSFEASVFDEINALPMQFYTQIGDMGSALSGGQKQRIILARALYRKPKVIFLDEATSHLDMNNEAVINSSVKSLSMTKIVVAHRRETILSCDRILKLTQDGLIDITQEFKSQ